MATNFLWKFAFLSLLIQRLTAQNDNNFNNSNATLTTTQSTTNNNLLATDNTTTTTISNEPEKDEEQHNYEVVEENNEQPEEVVINSESGVNLPTKNKHLSVTLFHKFQPILQPFNDKLAYLKNLLKHPNFNLINLPQLIWEKFHEKGHHFFSGPNGAIYGINHYGQIDYPFAYRKVRETTKKK